MLPGFSTVGALQRLAQGAHEKAWGPISMDHVQLCPQTFGMISEAVCDQLMEEHPHTQFRLHANARVEASHQLLDASTFNDHTVGYYRSMARISRRLDTPAYSLHAGYAQNATLQQAFENIRHIQDIFQDIPVAIEGLYPNAKREQLLSTWADYERLLETGISMAIDMSHLKIVARQEGVWREDLVADLLGRSQCLEIHLSENDGISDRHQSVAKDPKWRKLLDYAHQDAVCFSEGRLD
jgi:hypothetical protein